MFTEPVSFLDNVLEETGFLYVIACSNQVAWEWAPRECQCRKSSHMHAMHAGRGLRTGTPRLGYPCNRKRVGDLFT